MRSSDSLYAEGALLKTEANRRHQFRAFGALFFMSVCSFLIFLGVNWPFRDTDAGIPRSDPQALTTAAIFVFCGLWVSGLVFVLLGQVRSRSWLQYIGTAIAVPALLVGWWAIWLKPVQPVQHEAISVFNRYVTNFPRGALGRPSIYLRVGATASVCAPRLHTAGTIQFCADINTARPEGTQVIKSYDRAPSQ